jgi:Pyruvate/2-oxoacid:ferredoxin oxidoreductase delta subunit
MTSVQMTSEHRKKLKTLAKLMNKKNELPVPIARGVLELMGLAALPEDVDFLLRLGIKPHTTEHAMTKTGKPEAQAGIYLETLVKKGWIWPYVFEDGAKGYELLPIVVGWLELQLCHGRETAREKVFAQKVDEVFSSMRKLNLFPLRNLSRFLISKLLKPYQSIGAIHPPDEPSQVRKIAVNRALAVSTAAVQPTQYVSELVDRHGNDKSIAIVHCFCRQWRRLVNEPCRFDIRPETCMVVGPTAKRIADYDFGRMIEKKEALDILDEVSKAGALHTMFHERDDTRLPHVAICNCCWDCCGLYGGFNRGLFPLYFQSYYEARVKDSEACKGCEKCVRHCPTGAIVRGEHNVALTQEKCIGCGQCALQCPANSIELIPNRRNVLVPVPKLSEARLR